VSDVQPVLPNPNPSGSEYGADESVPVDPESLARHYEQDDVDVSAIMRFGAVIFVSAIVICLVLWIVVRTWTGHNLASEVQLPPALVTPPPVPGPGLDAQPEENLEMMLEHQNEWLHTYGWLDRDGGVVHIPIDQAMQLLVEQGVDARDGDAPDFRLAPAFRLDSSGGVTPAGGK